MNRLLVNYPQEVEALLAKYPPEEKRAAVMSLIYLAQRERNYLLKQDLNDIAEIVGISSTDVAALIGYYTLYHQEAGGKYRIQVCNDLPCALRGADEFLEKLCENLGIKVEETTEDGLITVEAVMCLAGCNRAPMFQVQSGDEITYHENQTVESAMALIQELRQTQAPAVSESAPSGERAAAQGQPTPETRRSGSDLPELNTPVLPVAEEGTTRVTRSERIKIMEEGGQ